MPVNRCLVANITTMIFVVLLVASNNWLQITKLRIISNTLVCSAYIYQHLFKHYEIDACCRNVWVGKAGDKPYICIDFFYFIFCCCF